MSSYGKPTGPDRRWRPSDADRERYAEAVSAAFSDGRISAEDMQSRTALVYEAATIADLEALVDDIPSASPTSPRPVPAVKRPPYGRMVLVGVLCAAAIVGAAAAMSSTPVEQHEATGGGVVEGDQDGGAAGLEPVDVDVPDIATEKPGLFTEEGLVQMWETMSAGDVSEIKSITVRPGHGMLMVRSDTEEPGLAEIRYEGGLASPPEWARTYSEQEGGFFGWGDVSPEAVAAAIEATPDALDMPDAEVDNAFVVRSSWAEGDIVINVVVTEGDRSSSARWDATGSTVLSTY